MTSELPSMLEPILIPAMWVLLWLVGDVIIIGATNYVLLEYDFFGLWGNIKHGLVCLLSLIVLVVWMLGVFVLSVLVSGMNGG